MNPKSRLQALKLLQKLEQHPSLAEELGIRVVLERKMEEKHA